MAELFGGHLVAKYLKETEGIDTVFSLSGGHIDRIYEGIRKAPGGQHPDGPLGREPCHAPVRGGFQDDVMVPQGRPPIPSPSWAVRRHPIHFTQLHIIKGLRGEEAKSVISP